MNFSIKNALLFSALCMSTYCINSVYAQSSIEGVKIEPNTRPIPYRVTKLPTFLKQCDGNTPANVTSVNSGCSNIPNSLLGSGSTIRIRATVNRQASGYRGIWHRISVVSNSSANQSSSFNAQSGASGWIRDNKL